LEKIDGVGAAVGAVAATGDGRLRTQLAAATGGLGADSAEFGRGSRMSTFRVTRRGSLFLVAGALAVVLIVALVYMFANRTGSSQSDAGHQPESSNECGPTMEPTPTQECVGIVENVDQVDENFRDVVDKILKHNEEVSRSPRYVKMALLTPMSISKTSPSASLPEQVQASLEGAYTALHRANTDADAPFGDPNLVQVQM